MSEIKLIEVDFVEVVKMFRAGIASGIIFATLVFVLSLLIMSFVDIVRR